MAIGRMLSYAVSIALGFVWMLNANAEAPVWLYRIDSESEFVSLSVDENSRPDMVRVSKYMTPAVDDPPLLQTVYHDVKRYPLHLEFMVNEFPDFFAGLDTDEYLYLVLNRSTRKYYAGTLYEFRNALGNPVYGFDIDSVLSNPPAPEDARTVFQQLAQTFSLRPLAYSPILPMTIDRTRKWEFPGLPIYLPDGLTLPEFEAYSPAVNYGCVRLYTIARLEEAIEEGLLTWQDIVVVDQTPTDIETVVAGVVTGTPQGDLSHVNVRTARRGTPNAYIKDAFQTFAPYEGQLILLTITEDTYGITAPVDATEAEVWWSSHRPQLPPLSTPVDSFSNLMTLPDLGEIADIDWLNSRFGGKTTGMALLYSILDRSVLVDGFAIPFHYYSDFMQTNRISHPTNDAVSISYQEYIDSLLQDSRFRSDPQYRRRMLESFQDYACSHGEIAPHLIDAIVAMHDRVFASPDIKVRFRSTSNVEDDIEFNGAGLYDSTSVCLLDGFDGDDRGPCLCDPMQEKERTIERGLKKVWMSLWNPKAFDERDYYQIDHSNARMGILVTRAFPTEDSNGVAFSGDPATGKKDYFLLNVQKGDVSVVQPDTGILPEKIHVKIDNGETIEIQRVRESSLLATNEWILTDSQIHEIASFLNQIDRMLPVNDRGFNRDRILMDVEFKYQNGNLVIKQVRPTLTGSLLSGTVVPNWRLY